MNFVIHSDRLSFTRAVYVVATNHPSFVRVERRIEKFYPLALFVFPKTSQEQNSRSTKYFGQEKGERQGQGKGKGKGGVGYT